LQKIRASSSIPPLRGMGVTDDGDVVALDPHPA
jgi:hypothetical protein